MIRFGALLAVFVAFQGEASSPIDLNAAQTVARDHAKARALKANRVSLQGVRAFRLAVDEPDKAAAIAYDPKDVADALELELRRSGIDVVDDVDTPTIRVSVTSVPTGESSRCCYVQVQAETIGFTDRWALGGTLTLYDAGTLFTSNTDPKERVKTVAVKLIGKFCLAWLRQNPGRS